VEERENSAHTCLPGITEKGEDYAQMCFSKGYTWGVALSLSDLSFLPSGKSGVTLRGEAYQG